MSIFKDANQARLSLKMLLSKYCWFNSTAIEVDDGDYGVVVNVNKLDNSVRKIVPTVHKNVGVRIHLQH